MRGVRRGPGGFPLRDVIGACSRDRSLVTLAQRRSTPLRTTPLERFDREVGRRTDVVGIFPDDRSLIRLASMLCIEQNDEWLVGRAYLSAESISLCLAEPEKSFMKEIKKQTPKPQAA